MVCHRSVRGPLLFLIYINDLSNIINNESVPVLFVDDTSILFTHSNPTDFYNNIHKVFEISSKWFKANLLSLKFEKTQVVQFTTKPNMLSCEKIGCDKKQFQMFVIQNSWVQLLTIHYLGEIILTDL
jgi:adenine-specific DNA methylase